MFVGRRGCRVIESLIIKKKKKIEKLKRTLGIDSGKEKTIFLVDSFSRKSQIPSGLLLVLYINKYIRAIHRYHRLGMICTYIVTYIDTYIHTYMIHTYDTYICSS